MNRAANAYFQTQTATTSQGEMLLLLYDGAIKFLSRAKEKISERDFAAKGIAISKAMDIISELDACLNVEKGGTLAENLHRLYMYCNTKLLDANLKMSIPYIDEVIGVLANLRGAYASVINTPEAQNAAKMAPPIASNTRMPTRAPQTSVLGRPVNQPGAVQSPPRPQQAYSAYKRDAERNAEPVLHGAGRMSTPNPAPAASGFGAAFAAQNTQQPFAAPASSKNQVPVSAQASPAQENRQQPAPQEAPQPQQAPGSFSRALTGSSLYRKMARQI